MKRPFPIPQALFVLAFLEACVVWWFGFGAGLRGTRFEISKAVPQVPTSGHGWAELVPAPSVSDRPEVSGLGASGSPWAAALTVGGAQAAASRDPSGTGAKSSATGLVSRYPRLVAQVVDAYGRPIRQHKLELHFQALVAPPRSVLIARATTDDAGRAEFCVLRRNHLGDRGIPVIADATSRAYAVPNAEVWLQPGVIDLGRLSLLEECERQLEPFFRARVVNAAGRAIGNFSAELTPEPPELDGSWESALEALGAARRQVLAGRDGNLQVFGLTADELHVHITAPGYRSHSQTYAVDGEVPRIQLVKESLLRGRLLFDTEIDPAHIFYVNQGAEQSPLIGLRDDSSWVVVTPASPEFILDLLPKSEELQILDGSSSALLYRQRVDANADNWSEPLSIDLRGQIRGFEANFVLSQVPALESFPLHICWLGPNGQRLENWVQLHLTAETGQGRLVGYVPSNKARFEIWMPLGEYLDEYLGKWHSFDAFDLPNPLSVPASLELSRVGEKIRRAGSFSTLAGHPNSAPGPGSPQNQ